MIHVHLTEAGSGKLEAVLPGHVAALVEEFSVLSAIEQETLGALCKKLGTRNGSGSSKTKLKVERNKT